MAERRVVCPSSFNPGRVGESELVRMDAIEMPRPNPVRPPEGYEFPRALEGLPPTKGDDVARTLSCPRCGYVTEEYERVGEEGERGAGSEEKVTPPAPGAPSRKEKP